jgi:UDP-glucose:tetrahydrobiopterin glucosyltransferase
VTAPFSVLVLSTPVGPIGSGVGGGVEITLRGIAGGLTARGHRVEVVAPSGSQAIGVPMHCVDGTAQSSMQLVDRSTVVGTPDGSVLANMWNTVRALAGRFDVVLNLAYDELPFLRALEIDRPVAHLVSMASLNDTMDAAIDTVLRRTPAAVAMHTRAQARTFANGDAATIVGGGVDVDACTFVGHPHADGRVAFVGRVSPEKGLVDVARACGLAGRPLHAWGFLQDPDEWRRAVAAAPAGSLIRRGFVDPDTLRTQIGECAALVMAPKWVEAFGNVVIEAMACGLPVVAYRRGGPAEVIEDAKTGFLVAPDDVEGLALALGRIGTLARRACRERAQEQYSTAAFAQRVEAWLAALVAGTGCADFPA